MVTVNLTEHLTRDVEGAGPLDAKVLFVTDIPDHNDMAAGVPLSGYIGSLFNRYLGRAGLRRTQIRIESVVEKVTPGIRYSNQLPKHELDVWKRDALSRINNCSANIVVPLGRLATEVVTGKESDAKWNLSVIPAVPGLNGRKAMPMLHPRRIFAIPKDSPLFTLGFQRISEQQWSPNLPELNYVSHINPTFDEAIAWLKKYLEMPYVGVDIETGRGQITAVGIGDADGAMSIPTLPEHWTEQQYFLIWQAIGRVLESNVPKVFQNFIYDTTYFSLYGIRTRALWHDTMLCQKFLHPELPMGLDTIARISTLIPYWKDEGKDWGMIGNPDQFYTYNCKDVYGMCVAALSQITDLETRGLHSSFQELVMDLCPQIAEMCWRGLPVDEETKDEITVQQTELLSNAKAQWFHEVMQRLNRDVNPNSPVQLKQAFKQMGYRLPTKDNKETTNAEALAKLRKKHPSEPIFKLLMDIRKSTKLLSSYLRFKYNNTDKRMRYSINGHGTETGRFSCSKDAFDHGLNAQTVPKRGVNIRTIFRAPRGKVLMQVDLAQAESRFVAWDGPVPGLMEFYNTGRDVHKYVASRIFKIPEDEIEYEQRQLGKKSGHGANYMVGVGTFQDQCLAEMGLVLTRAEADQALGGYHAAFPEVRTHYQENVKREVYSKRKLTTPMGRERLFYDRPGPAMEREACAYRPQSTIPDIINCLMKFMRGKVPLLLQNHDSLLFEVDANDVAAVTQEVRKLEKWHPKIILPGGPLIIPVDVEVGDSWGKMEAVNL